MGTVRELHALILTFSISLALKSPYVFGSDRLIAGMNVATEMMEFFFPVEYVGKPASEKVDKIYLFSSLNSDHILFSRSLRFKNSQIFCLHRFDDDWIFFI